MTTQFNFDFEKVTAPFIGTIFAIVLFATFSCNSPEPTVEPIDWAAYNDSSAQALEDSLRLDSIAKASDAVKVLPKEGRMQIEMILNNNF